MSRSQPQLKSPATRYMSWAGGEEGGGRVTYWDKQAEERKEVKLPFSFLVLDELNAIGGYSDTDKSSFWSNEVRDMGKSVLTAQTSKGIKARGLYGDIKDELKSKGGKYAKQVYIAFKDDTDEFAIGKLTLTGAALTAWIEYNKQFDVMKCATMITGGKKAKKGSNVYYTPIFEGQNVSPESNKAAEALDAELQTYFKAYFNSGLSHDSGDWVDEDQSLKPSRSANAEDVEIEDVDSEQDSEPKSEKEPATKEEPVSEGMSLKDVPF